MAITLQPSALQLDLWLKAISQGDRDALEKLYRATSSGVYAYALSILKNRHDAEDVLQDCYVTVFRCAGQYRSQDTPMAWIMTITRNLCYKLLQRQQRYTSLDPAEDFGSANMDADDRLMLQRCMKVLTDEERKIVVLHAVAGCSHREIGKHLNLKTSTVLSKYHRALKKLRTAI